MFAVIFTMLSFDKFYAEPYCEYEMFFYNYKDIPFELRWNVEQEDRLHILIKVYGF